ncbi:protein phosphatase 2C domain-containing protein [Fictibacillus nanhaiensis]|uniref:protein phosphatase 2C domain-containing protein n=1 Tax=Fictibacillus nanhaiensis TaxID=742169 RepID=UPI001C958A58|nr:protein phosphatase 2C domain-containing protein [Fictibacillus nanhaiensis]MBY6036604.1 protein phosphatase 2C domain-containing protein [Fictibacillus nanhaiensis]
MNEWSRTGSEKHFVDNLDVSLIGSIAVGRFGGNSSVGQYKNEDGCLVWMNESADWEFSMILDGHKTASSVELVINQFNKNKHEIQRVLLLPVGEALKRMDTLILDVFQEPDFMEACRRTIGETACMIVIRKEKYLWWFSIGDCILHMFHPELIALGERQLNQRSFYEWVGEVNTFEMAVPCYSTGKKELRHGDNWIFMTTDGLTECPGVSFADPKAVEDVCKGVSVHEGVQKLLEEVKRSGVRDSTTIISWCVNIEETATMPSDL